MPFAFSESAPWIGAVTTVAVMVWPSGSVSLASTPAWVVRVAVRLRLKLMSELAWVLWWISTAMTLLPSFSSASAFTRLAVRKVNSSAVGAFAAASV